MDRIAKLKEFLQATPNDSFLRHALGLELLKLGNDQEAKQTFEALLADDPAYVGTYLHIGLLVQRLGEEKEALQWFEKGMAQARKLNDKHALSELQNAYDDLNS